MEISSFKAGRIAFTERYTENAIVPLIRNPCHIKLLKEYNEKLRFFSLFKNEELQTIYNTSRGFYWLHLHRLEAGPKRNNCAILSKIDLRENCENAEMYIYIISMLNTRNRCVLQKHDRVYTRNFVDCTMNLNEYGNV